MASNSQGFEPNRLALLVEALLFVAEGPVRPAEMAKALGVDVLDIEAALERLRESYTDRGIRLLRERGRYQLASAPEAAPFVEEFLGLHPLAKLSRAALEAAAIIAYRQPVTRAEVSAIRGVDSDGVIRTLLARELIQEAGRLEQAGRPILYETALGFLQYFGLEALEGLPALPTAEDEAPEKSEPVDESEAT